MAQDGSQLAVLTSFLDAWAACDAARVTGLFAEDAVFIGSVGVEPGQTYRGRGEIGPAVEKMLAAAAGTRFQVSEMIPFGGGAVVTWAVDGIAASGHPVNVKGIDVFRVKGDFVTFKDAYRKVSA